MRCCSICHFQGHNRSNCFWHNTFPHIVDNNTYIQYITSSDFYNTSLTELLRCKYHYNQAYYDIYIYQLNLDKLIENYNEFDCEKLTIKDRSKLNDSCSICMEVCDNKRYCYQCNECNNVIHKKCAYDWTKKSKLSCPLCRTNWGKHVKAPAHLIRKNKDAKAEINYLMEINEKLNNYIIDLMLHAYHINITIDTNILGYIPESLQEKIIELTTSSYELVDNEKNNNNIPLPVIADGIRSLHRFP